MEIKKINGNCRNTMWPKRIWTFVFALIAVSLLPSCSTTNAKFFRGDVIGFSDKVKTSYRLDSRGLFMNLKEQGNPYDLLQPGDREMMELSIVNVPRGNNTTAYYAMELAAERVKYVRKKIAKNDPKTRYYIFLLTDGLDNASSQVAKNDGRIWFNRTPEQYQKRLQKKLKSAMGWSKNTFEVYTLLYEGEDMLEAKQQNNYSDEDFDKKLKEEMKCFRYSSHSNAPELISANDFETIFSELQKTLNNASYIFKVPKSFAGKKIRLKMQNEEGDTISFTAKLEKALTSYRLVEMKFSDSVTSDVKSGTLTSETSYEDVDNINAYFVIDDFRLKGVAYRPVKRTVTQEYESSPGFWQRNSEYSEVTNESINTYFILVIDGSRSLDGKNHDKNGFNEETELAKKILKIMSQNND